VWASATSSLGSDGVQPVAESENSDTNHGIERLAAAFGKRKRPGHYAKAKAADGARHCEAMFDNPANGPIYPSFVPKVDVDGNEIAGIRLPDVRVPIRTYSGWSLRSGVWANDGCEGTGQSVAFPATKAARTASGDPRLSIEERYPNFLDYYYKVTQAINDIVGERFMLPEDAGVALNRMLNAGFATGAIKMTEDE